MITDYLVLAKISLCAPPFTYIGKEKIFKIKDDFLADDICTLATEWVADCVI